LWINEQAPNPQISASTWCLAEANHRLLPKKRDFIPHKKSGFANPFKNPFGALGLLHPHSEAVFLTFFVSEAFFGKADGQL